MTKMSALDATVINHVPLMPAPAYGLNPTLNTLRAASAQHGFVVASNGLWLILRRPWIAAELKIASIPKHVVPYGEIAKEDMQLLCGPIPGALLTKIIEHFRASLPNEAAAFITWEATSRTFFLYFPVIKNATCYSLNYEPPRLRANEHLVLDVHSHNIMPAYFSQIDDQDDWGTIKLSMVIGHLDQETPEAALRLNVLGYHQYLSTMPFTSDMPAIDLVGDNAARSHHESTHASPQFIAKIRQFWRRRRR